MPGVIKTFGIRSPAYFEEKLAPGQKEIDDTIRAGINLEMMQ